MFKGKKFKLKKIYLHPVATYLLLSLIIIVVSGLLSLFNFQTTYNIVDSATMKLDQVTATVFNLFSFDGLKDIVTSTERADSERSDAVDAVRNISDILLVMLQEILWGLHLYLCIC